MRKILFGGGFDPIHNGHINMAKLASEALDADVIFVPASISVWKKTSNASSNDKLRMLELAIKDYPRFSISDYELTNGKETNYTIDTVTYFVSKYPNDEFFLLIGQDQVNAFNKWREAKRISELVRIVFMDRPNHEPELDNIKEYNMLEIKGELMDVSSTEVRNMKCLDKMNPDVLRYIEEQHLYYIEMIGKNISSHRCEHSIRVARLAYEIALRNNIDEPIKAYVAGLLHDVAKDLSKEDALDLMSQYFPEYIDMPSWSYHQFLSGVLAKKLFNINDEVVVEAMKYHASGNENMSTLGKIIYSSDKIEPGRGFDSSGLINACLDNYEAGFIDVLKANKEYLMSKKSDISNRLTDKCFNFYL